MRGHFLNYRAVGELLLFLGIAIAAVVAAPFLIRHLQVDAFPDRASATSTSRDNLAPQLAHCQAIGTAAQSDSTCLAAWRENRQRFFREAP